jgi:hypothetical protein
MKSFTYNSININDIYNIALTDSSILNKIDVHDLLKDVDEKVYEKMKCLSLSIIRSEIIGILSQLNMTGTDIELWIKKLKGYRYIDQINHLEKGKYVRWMRNVSTKIFKLTNGSYITDIKFTDNGTQILTINKGRFIQYKFDDCITFQKMSEEEQMILFLREKYDLQFI